MNKISIALNALLLIAVGVLFYLYFGLNSKLNPSTEGSTETGKKTPKLITDPSKLANAKIAFVNIDSISLKYDFISDRSTAIKNKQANLEGYLKSEYAKFQQDVEAFQQAGQLGVRPEAELMKEKERLEKKEIELTNKERNLQEIGNEVMEMQALVLQNVSVFIEKYNDGKFDYILAYTTSNISSVLYAKPDLDITNDIINGLNEEYRNSKVTPAKK